ncbi:hypothetical protein KZ829_05765 [Actinoplanes hulinensis]|uniref:Uncharacterized protein n=1 Tax=Actinoplanes hulinensis TaxID=1144547 RepID=A0ABS7AWZ4_9ACTN|nr:hypothetical protein [Actinoplanes hulinensis]MBW6433250.1 hypothetical protein [Actinoplanes hulinensis]
MPKYTKRSAAIITAGIVVVGGAGAAYAWTLKGSGSASATASSVAALTVSEVSSTPLVPGTLADVKFKVSNPNAFPVEITGAAFKEVTSNTAGCDSKFVEILEGELPKKAEDVTVPEKKGQANGTLDITFAKSLKLKNNAPNECIGAKFTFAVTVDAQTVGHQGPGNN